MTMLTGGIDMSAGTVASVSAFILGSQALHHDPAVAILIAHGRRRCWSASSTASASASSASIR